MEQNPYNLITFQGKTYTENVEIHISPTPDSILRVFMAYQALQEPIAIEAHVIEPFERSGFTVVVWGGTEVK